jgi:S-DNA-T family DNA segregation ATPase FtsK/SpoIIIE
MSASLERIERRRRSGARPVARDEGANGRLVGGVLLVIFAAVFACALVLPGEGLLADLARDLISPFVGAGRWVLPVLLAAAGIGIASGRPAMGRKLLAGALGYLALIGLLGFPGSGGSLGLIVADGLGGLVTRPGAAIVLAAIVIAVVHSFSPRLLPSLRDAAIDLAWAIGEALPHRGPAAETAAARSATTPVSVLPDAPSVATSADRPVERAAEVPVAKTKPEPAIAAAVDASVRTSEEPLRPLTAKRKRNWELPSLELLSAGRAEPDLAIDHGRNARVIEEKLASFGMSTRVTGWSAGPTVTQYQVLPEPSVKVARIEAVAPDLALVLAARSIRVEAPIPGRSAVGIEIPNAVPHPVGLREIFEDAAADASAFALPFAVGRDVAGTARIADLARLPHLLVAGATGSGKSVMVNAILTSLLLRADPDELRLILIDPKRVELGTYASLPHLLTPIVTEANKARRALTWAVGEMERRYGLLAESGVRDLPSYNEERKADRLPYIVIVVDEMADLMMHEGKRVEEPVVRIAQKARAVGIHLVIATQRPSVDVVTGLIKANIPARIAFAMASQIDSRTVIDGPGAEALLGKGDLLFSAADMPKPVRHQGAFVSDPEIRALVSHWSAAAKAAEARKSGQLDLSTD